jgi:hypothetical protein
MADRRPQQRHRAVDHAVLAPRQSVRDVVAEYWSRERAGIEGQVGGVGARATPCRRCRTETKGARVPRTDPGPRPGERPSPPWRGGSRRRRGRRADRLWCDAARRGVGPRRLLRRLARPPRSLPKRRERTGRGGAGRVREGSRRGSVAYRGRVLRRGDDAFGAHLRPAEGRCVPRVPPSAPSRWARVDLRADQQLFPRRHGRLLGVRRAAGPGPRGEDLGVRGGGTPRTIRRTR